MQDPPRPERKEQPCKREDRLRDLVGFDPWDVTDDFETGCASYEMFDKYTLEEYGLADPGHATVRVQINRDTVSREQRWVWRRERTRACRATWFVYREASDGDWPG